MFMSWLLGFCIIASPLALLIHLSNFNACIYQCVFILRNYFMQFLEIPRSILLLLVFVAFFKSFVILF